MKGGKDSSACEEKREGEREGRRKGGEEKGSEGEREGRRTRQKETGREDNSDRGHEDTGECHLPSLPLAAILFGSCTF